MNRSRTTNISISNTTARSLQWVAKEAVVIMITNDGKESNAQKEHFRTK